MKTIGTAIVILTGIILANIWKGYVLCILWKWFMITTFSLPALNIPTAIGIATVATMLIPSKIEEKKDEEKPFTERIANSIVISFIFPCLSLLVGWITKHWM